jgi:hypothetical protein
MLVVMNGVLMSSATSTKRLKAILVEKRNFPPYMVYSQKDSMAYTLKHTKMKMFWIQVDVVSR